jgi:hypothetical protein
MRIFFRSLAGTDIVRHQPRSWHRDRRRPEILISCFRMGPCMPIVQCIANLPFGAKVGVGDCGTTILVANGPRTRASRLDHTEQCEDVREDDEEGPFGACYRNT